MLSKSLFRQHRSSPDFQTGVTLIELMVAMVISLIASTGMVLLMANTMGTGTQTIQMTRLTQEMRTAMQLMTRDLRRANSHSSSAECYANPDCASIVDADGTKITAVSPVGGNCFRYWFDRDGDGDIEVGAFQMYTRGTVNVMQMTIGETVTPPCGSDWEVSNSRDRDITDSDIINITAFTVSNADSYNETISGTHTQDVSKIRLTMTAELRNTPQGVAISKTIENLIFVRNHVFCPTGGCP